MLKPDKAEMADLKPCRKCKSKDLFYARSATSHPAYRIKCNHCGYRTAWYNSPEETIDAWNRRANDVE